MARENFASPVVNEACCFSCRNSKVCLLTVWWWRAVGAEGSSGPSDQGWGLQTRHAGRMVLAKGFLSQATCVFKLLVLLLDWRGTPEEMHCKRALIHDWE